MNYDEMSVRELVREIVREENLALDIGVTGDDWTTLNELESALRKVVIREASVGRVSIKHVVGVGNFVDDAKITFSKRRQDRHWLDYDLIPKETP